MVGDFSAYQTSIYKALINAGSIVFIIGMFSTGSNSINCFLSGYATLSLAMMMLLIQVLNNLQTKKTEDSSIATLIITLFPFILLLCVTAYLFYLTFVYKDIIIEGHVSSGYGVFSNIVTILILIQMYIIYSEVSSKSFQEKGISSVTMTTILLLGVISAIATNILRTILKYFTTDGFDIMKI
jgi:hypothetical protein